MAVQSMELAHRQFQEKQTQVMEDYQHLHWQDLLENNLCHLEENMSTRNEWIVNSDGEINSAKFLWNTKLKHLTNNACDIWKWVNHLYLEHMNKHNRSQLHELVRIR